MSKHQVTITLGGRSGQVVRRRGSGSEDAGSETRNKPSRMKDRLGSNVASSSLSCNRRLRGDGSGYSAGSSRSVAQLGRNDLRLKLMRKKISKQTQGGAQNHKKDLREMLSRTIKSPMSVDMHHKSELKESRVSRQDSSIRNVDNSVQVESSRSYSSVIMDAYRPRSPNRVSVNYREVSPPRNIDDPRRVSVRTMDASRSPSSMNIIIMRQGLTRTEIDALRHGTMSTSCVNKPPKQIIPPYVAMQVALEISRSVSHMPPLRPPPPQAQAPATNGIMQRSSYMGDHVCDLLHSLGLGKYYINFQAEEVDMTALRQMGDNDLKEMGIPMGKRKKILLALTPPSRRPPQ